MPWGQRLSRSARLDKARARTEKFTPSLEQLEARDEQHEHGYPVAEAVFAGEEVKELPLDQPAAAPALVGAPVAHLAKDFFRGHGARDAGYRNRQRE